MCSACCRFRRRNLTRSTWLTGPPSYRSPICWNEPVARAAFNPGTRRTMMFGNLRLIDLSVPLEHNAVSEPMPAEVKYITHDGEGRQQMLTFFGMKPEDLVYSNGLGWAIEEVNAITHTA